MKSVDSRVCLVILRSRWRLAKIRLRLRIQRSLSLSRSRSAATDCFANGERRMPQTNRTLFRLNNELRVFGGSISERVERILNRATPSQGKARRIAAHQIIM